MWGSLNDRLTSVRSTITKVAHDVIEQAEEMAAPPPESEYAPPSHTQQPAKRLSDTSGGTSAAPGESSSLAALKARLQAEKSRSQEQHSDLERFRHASQPSRRNTGDGDTPGSGLPTNGPLLPSKATFSQPGLADNRTRNVAPHEEIAKLQAQVKHLKTEIIHTSQANDEELDRLDAERTMEVGTLKAELEGVRKQLAAQRRRSAERESAGLEAAATGAVKEAERLRQMVTEAQARVQQLEEQLSHQKETAQADVARQEQQVASALSQAADASSRVEALQAQLDTERSSAREEAAARAAGASKSTDAAQQLVAEVQQAHENAARAEAELRQRLSKEVAAREAAEGQASEFGSLASSASQKEAALRDELATLKEEAAKAEAAWKSQAETDKERSAAAEVSIQKLRSALENAEHVAREAEARAEAQAVHEREEAASRIRMLKQQLEQLAGEREQEESAASRAKALAEQAARAELEAAQARAAQLEAELRQATLALEAATSASAGAERGVQEELARAKSDASRLGQQLAEARASLDAQGRDLARLREEAGARQEAVRVMDGEARRRQEELSNEVQGLQAALSASRKRAESAEKRANGAEQSLEAAQANGQQSALSEALQAEVVKATAGREAAEKEKERALRMLKALKQQIAESEMEEEEKLSWRVEAEVRLALDEYQRSEASRTAPAREEVATLVKQLEAERSLRQGMEADVNEWRIALEAKDSELANLQLALGELAYTSEAGEKLRTELRAAHAETERIQAELVAQGESLAEAQAAKEKAEMSSAAAKEEVSASAAAQKKLQEGAIVLRRALEESTRRMNKLSTDNNSLIDRRIVVQLMVSYFERRHSTEVLDVMERMLGFTAEDKARIEAARRGRGVLSRVAGVPFAVLRGITGSGSHPDQQGIQKSISEQETDLAEAWVEFLIHQAEGMGAEEQSVPDASGKTEPNIRPQSYAPEPAASSGPGLVASLCQYQSSNSNPSGINMEMGEGGPHGAAEPVPSGQPEVRAAEGRGGRGVVSAEAYPYSQPGSWPQHSLGLPGVMSTHPDPQGAAGLAPARQGSSGSQADGQFTSMSLESPKKPLAWLPTVSNGVGQHH